MCAEKLGMCRNIHCPDTKLWRSHPAQQSICIKLHGRHRAGRMQAMKCE